MPPQPTGQVIERQTARGRVFALRFCAYGRRHFLTLGGAGEGWTREKAEAELRYVMADVERGLWASSAADRAPAPDAPTFHEFASEWMAAKSREVREATVLDYRWQLSNHLLPFFHAHRLADITVAEVDRYRGFKVREGALSIESINKTITRLGQILAVAEERDLITRNPRPRQHAQPQSQGPARPAGLPRQRRADRRATRRRDRARRLADGAYRGPSSPDRHARLPGLRIGEATALRWRDVDLARGRIMVGASKTDAGIREVDILPVLADELATHRHANSTAGADELTFPTSAGTRRDKDNARERVIRPVVRRADDLLEERRQQPLPEGVTAHKLRHTFASILFVRGVDPPTVMQQLGHTDAAFTLRVYAHAMRRNEDAKERLKALVNGLDWAPLGTGDALQAAARHNATTPNNDESPADAGLSDDGRGGFRTCDLSRVKRALSH
jgi:integrase